MQKRRLEEETTVRTETEVERGVSTEGRRALRHESDGGHQERESVGVVKRARGGPTLTHEQSIIDFIKEHPELYTKE